MRSFEFQSAEEFEDKAKSIVLEWLPRLAGRSFHVRLHRRGARHALRTPDVERRLDDALLDALQEAGTPGKLSFSDPGCGDRDRHDRRSRRNFAVDPRRSRASPLCCGRTDGTRFCQLPGGARGSTRTRQGAPCSIEMAAMPNWPMVQALVIRCPVERGAVNSEAPAAIDSGNSSWSAR